MTADEVQRIYAAHKSEFLKSDEEHRVLAGLLLLGRRLKLGANEDISAEHDILYAYSLDVLPRLTEQDVIQLNRLGWHWDEDTECFAKFT